MMIPSLEAIKERKVVQWGLAYLAGAWLVLQVVAVLGATYDWPRGLLRAVPVVLLVGFFVALVLAWYHGERGAQRVSGPEVTILTVLLVIAGIGASLVGRGSPEPAEVETTAVAPNTVEADETSVAVLPFENLSRDSEQSYFADGLTEDLLNTLAQSPSLRVVGRTSSFAFKGSNALADSIGRALGVAHLVQGSVRREGDRVRISAQLMDAATGFEEWSDTYERAASDVFDVQYGIARSIYRHLSLADVVARAEPGTDDPEAYTLVQEAEALRRLDTGSGHGAEAEQLYERALALDPSYAAAWSGLAWARYMQRPQSDEEWTQVRAAAEQALALDDDDAGAHHLLGEFTRYHDEDDEAALAHFQRAVETDPSNAYVRITLAELLIERLRQAEALRAAERALLLGPLEETVHNIAGIVYYRAGLYERAEEAFASAVVLDSTYAYAIGKLAVLRAILGRTDDALPVIERGLRLFPRLTFMRRDAAYVYAQVGQRAEAEQMLAGISGTYDSGNYDRAVVEAALGNRDAAFAALERAINADEYALHELAGGPTDPKLRALYDDERWEPFIARVRSDEWMDGEWGT